MAGPTNACITNAVWPVWTNTATSSAATVDVWPYWTASVTICDSATTCTTGPTVWAEWINGQIVIRNYAHQQTAEEIAERDRRMEEARVKATEQDRLRKEAEAKSEALLRKCLTAHQQRLWRRKKYFDVVTPKRRRYRVYSGKVTIVGRDRKEKVSLCIHPDDHRIPHGDSMLAKKLMLETDEDCFLRIANPTRLLTDTEADEIMREASNLRMVPA